MNASFQLQLPGPAIRERVRSWLVETFILGTRVPRFTDTDSLIDAHVLDSTGVLELVAFLELSFDISIDDEDVRADNLDSIAAIDRLVSRLSAGRP